MFFKVVNHHGRASWTARVPTVIIIIIIITIIIIIITIIIIIIIIIVIIIIKTLFIHGILITKKWSSKEPCALNLVLKS